MCNTKTNLFYFSRPLTTLFYFSFVFVSDFVLFQFCFQRLAHVKQNTETVIVGVA